MATDLYQGWDHRWLGTATVSLANSDLGSPYSISFTAGKYGHLDLSTIDPDDGGSTTIDAGFSDFATAFTAAIAALSPDNEYTLTWDSATLAYTLTNDGAQTFSLTFTGAAGTTMRRILGLTANTSGATTYTSDMRPWYVVRAEVDGRTRYDQPAAKAGQIRAAMGDDGTQYTLVPTRLVRESRWEHHFEQKAHVHRRFADADTLASGVSYSWEAWLDHAARYSVPCVIKDATESMVFFTSQGFDRGAVRRRQADADPQQIVSIRADSILGYL